MSDIGSEPGDEQALLAATRALLGPLARLLVARGVTYAAADESLKAAMVEAARAAHSDGLPHRLVSRIATTTGINRREVTRLTRDAREPAPPQRSAAANLFTRWRTAPAYRDARGEPRRLPRQGDAPSFEALARSVTQDVHPRSLLDELLRLGVARHDLAHDTVALTQDAFVPRTDRAGMLEFLAHNVGDHLCAAVDNVIGPAPRHLERAVFADGLSPESVAVAQDWVGQTWRELLGGLVPLLENLIAGDAARPDGDRTHRFRAGLYAYSEAAVETDKPAAAAAESQLDAPVAVPIKTAVAVPLVVSDVPPKTRTARRAKPARKPRTP